jgi:hypothetical protein
MEKTELDVKRILFVFQIRSQTEGVAEIGEEVNK